MTKPRAVGGAFDKPRNIGGNETAFFAGAHDAEIRRKSCEMIIGYLRLRRGNSRKYRRLSDVRKTDKTYVGEHFEFKLKIALLALRALFCEHRHLPRRRCKMTVAPAAATSATAYKGFVVRHIFDYLSGGGVLYERSCRNFYFKVFARRAVKLRSASGQTVCGGEFALISESEQGIAALVDLENYIAAATAVASVGAAVADVLFAPERNGTVAAVACLDVYSYYINKHQSASSPFIRITSFMGVPTNPNAFRMQFSIYLW